MERHKVEDGRPSPEALLEEANKEHRGKLKIFLGASPGVGKTYAMLGDAMALKKEGLDVVIGIVETHGRKDTEALTKGLEIIPRKNIVYRNITFQEMDIDAILERNPKVVLVDELAHTNIEGSRHPKRYQDVEELLNAGIDVFSTINIQHIESLNGVVSKISGIQIKETVPDRVLQMADEIELVDIPPKELQKRLQEGKVYVPEQAKKAIHNFFTQSNLTALREMALRFTAERVDSQMLQLMQVQGIAENWPTRDRIMVCIGDDYEGMELVRICHQTATRWKAPWMAVHVNTDSQTSLATDTDYVTKALHLAEELGGEVVTLAADDIVGEILQFAKSRNVSHIIVGKPPKRKWYRIFNQPFAIELYKRSTFLKVILVPTVDIVVHEREEKKKKNIIKNASKDYVGYIVATFACLIALFCAMGVDYLLPVRNLSLIFMLAILYVASRYGLFPALYTLVLGLFSYNFFFIEPRYTIGSFHREHMLNSFFFILVATLVSKKASAIRDQVQAIQQNADRTASLYGFSKKISAASDTDTVYKAVVRHLAEIFNVKVTMLVPVHDMLKVVGGYPHLDELARGAAMWSWKKNEAAGHSTSTLPASQWMFVPMQTDSGAIGVIGIEFLDKTKVLLSNQKRILDALSHQAAVAIERIQLSETISEAKVHNEAEKLRSALLSSIAHDFCEPIAVVMDKVWKIRDDKEKLNEEEHQKALDTIYKEVSRMNRFVKNIVDICKSGSDKIDLKKELINIEDIFSVVEERSSKLISMRKIIVNIEEEMPQIEVDPVLLEQAVTNIFTNFCEASNDGRSLKIDCKSNKEMAVINFNYINDNIRKDEIENIIFELSADKDRLSHKQTNLALVRFMVTSSIIEAHGGGMRVEIKEDDNSLLISLTVPFLANEVQQNS